MSEEWLNDVGGVLTQHGVTNTGTSEAAVITSGIANTKGSYGDLIASTNFNADGIIISGHPETHSNLLDIAIGAASFEKNILENFMFSNGKNGVVNLPGVDIPIQIPKGTRISARFQSTNATVKLHLSAQLYKLGWQTPVRFSGIQTWGANIVASDGTDIDPGTTAHTDSAWVEFVSAANNKFNTKRLYICSGNSANGADSDTRNCLLDIAVGAAGSEIEILSDLSFRSTANDMLVPTFQEHWVDIPAGTRVSARMRSNYTLADRLAAFAFYGLY